PAGPAVRGRGAGGGTCSGTGRRPDPAARLTAVTRDSRSDWQMIARPPAFLIAFLLFRAAAAQTAEELAQTAARAMQQQDYATAENAYRQFLQLSPNVAEVYSNLGLACYSQKKLPCAEEALTHALKLAPDLFVPNFLLGEIRFQ